MEDVPFLIGVWETGLNLRHSASYWDRFPVPAHKTVLSITKRRSRALLGHIGTVWRHIPTAAWARTRCPAASPQATGGPALCNHPAAGSARRSPARAPCAPFSLAEGVPPSSHRLSQFSSAPLTDRARRQPGKPLLSPGLGAEARLGAARGAERGGREPLFPPGDALVEPSPANGRRRKRAGKWTAICAASNRSW